MRRPGRRALRGLVSLFGPSFTSGPTASGTVGVGLELAVVFTASGVPMPAPSYRWLRDGVAIGGATSAAYTCVPADVSGAPEIACEVALAGRVVVVATSNALHA